MICEEFNGGFNYLNYTSIINNYKSQTKNLESLTKKIDNFNSLLNKNSKIIESHYTNYNNLIKYNFFQILNNIIIITGKLYNLNEFICSSNKSISLLNEMINRIKLSKIENEEKNYSYECLNLNEKIFIDEETPNACIKIILKNNNKLSWPKGETKLVFCQDSQLLGVEDFIILKPQEYNEIKEYNIIILDSEKYPKGLYNCYLSFEVNGENYGEIIHFQITIKQKENTSDLNNIQSKYLNDIN